MLLSILANIFGLYSLLSLPVSAVKTIDVSLFEAENKISLINNSANDLTPIRKNNNSLGMDITAESAVVVDNGSGLVLWQKNPTIQRPIASITKLMTALVFLDHNPGWDQIVTIQSSDYRPGGLTMVYAGEQMYVRDLFNASLVASSNNSTVALARVTGLSESEFIEKMNAKAEELGMVNSFFTEPTGLDPANVSTAADLVKLIQAALSRTEIRQATVLSEYKLEILNAPRVYTLKSTDKLLSSFLQINGGKTGYLEEAGYCLGVIIEGDKGQLLTVIVLGSETENDRFQDVKALGYWAFNNFEWPE